MTLAHLTRRAILASVTLGIALACQSGEVAAPGPLAPTARASLDRPLMGAPRGRGFAGNEHNDFHAARCTDRRVASSSGVFGPAGGTLTIGASRLIIPGGALHDTVTISATIVDSLTSRVELQPHGLQFDKPAGLLLSTQGCVLSPDGVPVVVYLSEDGLVLETLFAFYDPRWKTFAVPIHHFSGYAIAF